MKLWQKFPALTAMVLVLAVFAAEVLADGAFGFGFGLASSGGGTSAGGGYFESFMGTEGTINISERAAYTNIYRESGSKRSWDPLVQSGYLKKVAGAAPAASGGSDAIASYESAAPAAFARSMRATIESRSPAQ